jgi:hypothetical protein
MEDLFSYGWSGFVKFLKKNLVFILYTLIFHLVILIILAFLKVDQLKKQQEAGISIEFEEKTVEDIMEEAEMEVPAEWLEEILRQREAASNQAVNVNAEERLSSELSTSEYVNDLLEQIEQARDQEDRERLEELQSILAEADYAPPPEDDEEERGEFTGPTTITYEFLEEPRQRGKVHLTIPVYRCQGSGLVTVVITVNRDGSVKDARVRQPIIGDDQVCFSDAALAAARTSRFRIDLNAPDPQQAIITYQFVAQ